MFGIKPRRKVSDNSSPSAISYCERVAGILTAPVPQAKFRAALTIDEWREVFGDKPLTIEVLFEALIDSPRLQSIASSATDYTPSVWLLEQELIAQGKAEAICGAAIPFCGHIAKQPPSGPCTAGAAAIYNIAQTANATGLCLSGGGIRSATFNLGVLQALSRLNLLEKFTYLSSVSGGGYIHQFLAAWLHNCEKIPGLGKPPLQFVEEHLDPLPQDNPPRLTEQPDPIRWLRRYSNYLTPRTGIFSSDTWVMISVWLRNTFLNQIVLVAFLAAILCLPRFLLTEGVVYHWFNALYTESFFGIECALPALLIAILGIYILLQLVGLLQTRPFVWTSKPRSIEPMAIRRWKVVAIAVLAISVLTAPALYRTSFVTPTPYDAANLKIASLSSCAPLCQSNPDAGALTTTHFLPGLVDFTAWCNYVVPNGYDRFQALRNWFAFFRFPFWDWHGPEFAIEFILLAFVFLLSAATAMASSEHHHSWAFWSWVSAIISTAATFGMLYLLRLGFFALTFFVPPALFRACAVVLIPVLVSAVIFLCFVLTAGIMGNLTDDARREDMARLRALGFLLSFVWLAATGFSLLGPELARQLVGLPYVRSLLSFGWVGTTIASVLAGKSSKTSSSASDSGFNLQLFIKIGPPVFVIGLLLLICVALDAVLAPFCNSELSIAVCVAVLAAVAALFGSRLDINDFSMHAFYRDRIARCFAGASHPHRRPDRFTGFADSDSEIHVADLLPKSFSKNALKTLNDEGETGDDSCAPTGTYSGPFPIFCTSVNLTFGQDLAWQERKAASFAFTPLYSGYSVGFTSEYVLRRRNQYTYNGFVHTPDYAYYGGIRMHSAVAISGAAVSPNMGYHTDPAMAFLLTMFNVRLGWWIRNTRLTGSPLGSRSASPRFPLLLLLKELTGRATDTEPFVYLTDGGHFDNMGLYELVRRRCRRIVICDAEEDANNTFEGIGMAIRKARVDFGVEITLDLRQLDPRVVDPAQVPPSPVAPAHYVTGTIRYPEDDSSLASGTIIYIKAGITGDEPGDVLNYKRQHTDFPHESTADQWFSESQFESYRRLGYHSILDQKQLGGLTPPLVKLLKQLFDPA
jgi:hypothetical protein